MPPISACVAAYGVVMTIRWRRRYGWRHSIAVKPPRKTTIPELAVVALTTDLPDHGLMSSSSVSAVALPPSPKISVRRTGGKKDLPFDITVFFWFRRFQSSAAAPPPAESAN